MKKVSIFLGSMLYGTCWTVSIINLAALVLGLAEGRSPFDYLSMILIPAAIILYFHHLAGWFPFHRQA